MKQRFPGQYKEELNGIFNYIIIIDKFTAYRSLIQLIGLYGCETWTLAVLVEKKLLAFEITTLKTLLGVR